MYGSCDEECLGWVGRLRKQGLDNEYDNAVYNRGVCGDTVAGVLKRFDTEFAGIVYKLDAAVFAIGINDTVFRAGNAESETSIEAFTKDVENLLVKAKAFGVRVFLVGLTSVDESLTSPLAESSTGKYFANDRIKQYDDVLRVAAKEQDVQFIEMSDQLSVDDLADGLHPNAQGYEKMFRRVSDHLR